MTSSASILHIIIKKKNITKADDILVKTVYHYLIYCDPIHVNLQLFFCYGTSLITIERGIKRTFWWEFLPLLKDAI